jgi:hypothetical protein
MVTNTPGAPGGHPRLDALLDAVRAFFEDHECQPIQLSIFLANGGRVSFPVPPATPAPAAAAPPACTHSGDFRSAVWKGTPYTFTPTQAAVVRQLWRAWEVGAPAMGQDALLEGAESESRSLSDLFRTNPALGTMIVESGNRTYQLNGD